MEKIKRLINELVALVFILDSRSYFKFLGAIFTSLPSMLRKRNLSDAHQKMWGHQCVFNVYGQKMILDGYWLGYAAEVYARKVYFALPGFEIRDGMNVVDAGPAGGEFAILAAKLGARVVAIEAARDSFEALRANVEQNGVADKISALWGLVGERSGILSDPLQLLEFNAQFHNEKNPPVLKMREVLANAKMDRVDFLKMDIEGSEYDVLERDNEWLGRVDRIAMEIEQNYGSIPGMLKMLKDKGFKVWLVNNSQKVVPVITTSSGYLFAIRSSVIPVDK